MRARPIPVRGNASRRRVGLDSGIHAGVHPSSGQKSVTRFPSRQTTEQKGSGTNPVRLPRPRTTEEGSIVVQPSPGPWWHTVARWRNWPVLVKLAAVLVVPVVVAVTLGFLQVRSEIR